MADIPTYLKIAEDLKNKIHNKELMPGELVPSESSLCEIYSTSKMTVRKALLVLQNSGYIYSITGKGTYVNIPNLDDYKLNFNELKSNVLDINETEIINVDLIFPDMDMIYNLQIPKEHRVIMIQRLYKSDSIVVAYDEKFIPYSSGIPLIEQEINFATFPEIIALKTSAYALKKEIYISVKKTSAQISKYLEIAEGEPIIQVEQKMFDANNVVIGWGKIYYKYDSLILKAVASAQI